MIIVFTNRVVRTGSSDESLFGDTQNTKSSNELRIAVASKHVDTGRWTLDLQEETSGQQEPPSKILFRSVLAQVVDGQLSPNWVVAVHGYGQSFQDSLEEAHGLQDRYQVNRADTRQPINVILFSWPSNPDGIIWDAISAYRRAQMAAVPSAAALARVLQKLWDFFAVPALSVVPTSNSKPQVPGFTLCMHVHSQGNLVLEYMTQIKVLEGSPLVLNTLILHQADVDLHGHHEWVNRINFASDIVITLNTKDFILILSDAINPARLGMARSGFNSRANYFDFTGGDGVNNEHNLFLKVNNNDVVRRFCERALTGFPVAQMGGEVNGFWFDQTAGAWRLLLQQARME